MDDEDLPDDFFDDFAKNDFLQGFSENKNDEDRNSVSSGIHERQSSVLREIQRLERDIELRKKKIRSFETTSSRSPSPYRSQSPSQSKRRRGNSRSRDRSHHRSNRRSRSRSRSRKDRNKRSRSPTTSSRNKRSKSRQNSTGRSISFLEELAQKFREQGKAFPEAEEFARFKNQNQPHQVVANHPSVIPNMMPVMYPNQMVNQQIGFPAAAGYQQPPPGLDLYPPGIAPVEPPKISMVIHKEPVSTVMDITKRTNKEKVINICHDAIKSLRENKSGILPKRFLYAKTVLSVVKKRNQFETPLKGENNIEFKLTSRNFDETKLPVRKLSNLLGEIVTILGFPLERFVTPEVKPTNLPSYQELAKTASVGTTQSNNGALPANLSETVGTQTDETHCKKCMKLSMKVFKHESAQTTRADVNNVGCQTMNEDTITSLAELTPAQLVAINEFGKVLRGDVMPTSYRQATELREKIYHIYEKCCTGSSSNNHLQQQQQHYSRDIGEQIDRDIRSNLEYRGQNSYQNRDIDNMNNQRGGGGGDMRHSSRSENSNGMLTSREIMELEFARRNNNFNRMDQSQQQQQKQAGPSDYYGGRSRF